MRPDHGCIAERVGILAERPDAALPDLTGIQADEIGTEVRREWRRVVRRTDCWRDHVLGSKDQARADLVARPKGGRCTRCIDFCDPERLQHVSLLTAYFGSRSISS